MANPKALFSNWTSRVRDDQKPVSEDTARLNAEEAARQLRQVAPDLYFINTPVAHMSRHWELLKRLPQENLLLDFYRYSGARLTELTICSYDDTEPGLLSKVCGTLAALNVDIKSALIYTLHGSGELAKTTGNHRAVALDTLILSEPYAGYERALTERKQRAICEALRRVLSGEVTVAQLLASKKHRPHPPLTIYDIQVEQEPEETLTRLTLRAADSAGVLYRTTAALVELELNIWVAQINTQETVTDDIFFVNHQNGQPLSSQECATIAPRLRAILQNSAVPYGLTG
jgi:UTP:GlnB (protein PII) uridylyltransferase